MGLDRIIEAYCFATVLVPLLYVVVSEGIGRPAAGYYKPLDRR